MHNQTPLQHLQLEVNIVRHCNLNCQMCDHFSPLSDVDFLSLSEFKHDIKKLAKTFHNRAKYIYLLGGEPLLHPEIKEFIKISRHFFPKSNVIIYTNALNLLTMDSEFILTCRTHFIKIYITKYPINMDYNKLELFLKYHRINYKFVNTSPVKTSSHYPLDPNGKQDARDNFSKCIHANNCITLNNGKLYTCSIIPNIDIFNKYFSYNIPVTPNDYIDIHQENSPESILKRLCQPFPFCKYCNIKKRSHNHPWKISNQDIREWL